MSYWRKDDKREKKSITIRNSFVNKINILAKISNRSFSNTLENLLEDVLKQEFEKIPYKQIKF